MNRQHPIIRFEDVWFRYPSSDEAAWAVQNLNLAIHSGQNVAVVGQNGSGKSTFAKLACGLLTPDRGTVTVDEHDTADTKASIAVHSACGYVFQNPDDQLVASRVEDEVAFGPENLGLERNVIRHRVTHALEAVGLTGFEQREVDALSGGQKQRLAIAGTLALQPQALVLDEAASMLDPQGRRELAVLLDRLRDQGIATVSITHFMEDALEADTVLALEGGRIAYCGNPEGLFGNYTLLQQLGLAEPFVVQMRRLLAERGIALPFCRSVEQLAALYREYRRSNTCHRAEGEGAPQLDRENDTTASVQRNSADLKADGQ